MPIGDEDFGFRGNAVAGEHVNQVITGKGWNNGSWRGRGSAWTNVTCVYAGELEVEVVRGRLVVADEGGGALGAFGYPLPDVPVFVTHLRPRHRVSVVCCYPTVHMFVFSFDFTFLVLHFPRPLHPKHRCSVAGWYPAVHVFLFLVWVLHFLDPLSLLLRSLPPVISA